MIHDFNVWLHEIVEPLEQSIDLHCDALFDPVFRIAGRQMYVWLCEDFEPKDLKARVVRGMS